MDEIDQMRTRITEIGRMLFERHLTDAAGGNISARVGERICITARYSGSKYQWHLRPEQVLVSDLEGNKLDGEGDISREAKVHFHVYREFPEATAVVHGHAQNALVFACARLPIEPVLEDTLKFGTIEVTDFGPSHSNTLAEAVVRALNGQNRRIRQYAAAVLAPWHGVFAVGRDIDAAFDTVERVDTNARCILMSRLLIGTNKSNSTSFRLRLEEAMLIHNDPHFNSQSRN